MLRALQQRATLASYCGELRGAAPLLEALQQRATHGPHVVSGFGQRHMTRRCGPLPQPAAE